MGNEIRKSSAGYDHEFFFTDIEELDLTNACYVEAFFNDHTIDYCINCAAYTAVDKAESELEIARKINVDAAKNLALACADHETVLIHLSTDFVFNGRSNTPYTEQDEPDPINVYGKTKLDGENAALNHNKNTIIIRTSWLYSSFGNNFVKTMLRVGHEKDALNVIFDQLGSPTYAGDLAAAILQIIRQLNEGRHNINDVRGIYHYSNEGVASWYDFAHEIFRQRGIDIHVTPVRTKEYPTPATRPQFSVMDKSSIKEVFDLQIPYWQDSLAACINLIDQTRS